MQLWYGLLAELEAVPGEGDTLRPSSPSPVKQRRRRTAPSPGTRSRLRRRRVRHIGHVHHGRGQERASQRRDPGGPRRRGVAAARGRAENPGDRHHRSQATGTAAARARLRGHAGCRCVRNDATIPAAAFRQGHPWRLTLACAVPGPARLRAGARLQALPARARASPRAWGGAAICALPQARVIQGAGQGSRPGI